MTHRLVSMTLSDVFFHQGEIYVFYYWHFVNLFICGAFLMAMNLKVLDLFSGIGGFSYGLEKTGHFTTVGFCEIEKNPAKVLQKHYPKVTNYKDIMTLHGDDLPKGINVFCGGFPCQDISKGNTTGNKQGLDGSRSGLWYEYKRLINEYKPQYIIIENVYDLLHGHIATVLKDLAEVGYDATWTVFDTQFFGLPQRRRRVYILAVRDGIPAQSDIFRFGERDSEELRAEIRALKKERRVNFKEGYSYFTRQRSTKILECGLSSTLAKRDFKSYTDVVYHHNTGTLRRVMPKERLLLQGFPIDWFDGLDISMSEQYKMNGMSIPVVTYVGRCLFKYHFMLEQ